MVLNEFLGACCECDRIRIEDDFWLSREENPERYDSLRRGYEDRISHTYCPTHFQEAMKKLEEDQRDCPKD